MPSVRTRLHLLMAALFALACAGAYLLWKSEADLAGDHVITARMDRTLREITTVEVAQKALLDFRRTLHITLQGTPSQQVSENLARNYPPFLTALQASADRLQELDPAVAITLRQTGDRLLVIAQQAATMIAQGHAYEATAMYLQAFMQTSPVAEKALENLFDRERAQLTAVLQRSNDVRDFDQNALRVIYTTLIAVCLGSLVFLARTVLLPLDRMKSALNQVSAGQTLATSPVDSADEFGQMGRALHELSQITANLKEVAFQDALTRLPNRARFERDLGHWLETKTTFTLVFADIDHFRTINDGYGHRFGDQVLRSVAERLQWLMQQETRLYRYSGDLFVLVAPAKGENARTQIAADVERLRISMSEIIKVEDRSLPLCLSFGVALFPDDGANLESLVSAADAAIHQAKRLGRNAVQFARGDYAIKARRRLELADDLRDSIQRGAISPFFQPIVDLAAGRVVCAEALARWKHPQRGFVPPDEFINIAEESGQIDQLTRQLLLSACRTAVTWGPVDGRDPPRLAFNLSPRQVRQGVVEMVTQALTETGLPADRLEIEITESAIIERPETAERLLRELKEIGVSVALDDFGTGYSSLSYLLRFPIDKIKVDRSFVAQLQGQRQAGKIVAATIALATSLDITLVAEGVENLGQMVTLYELGCRQQQGWLFAKALPAADFDAWKVKAPLRLDAVVRAQAEAANEITPAA